MTSLELCSDAFCLSTLSSPNRSPTSWPQSLFAVQSTTFPEPVAQPDWPGDSSLNTISACLPLGTCCTVPSVQCTFPLNLHLLIFQDPPQMSPFLGSFPWPVTTRCPFSDPTAPIHLCPCLMGSPYHGL